MQKDWELVFRSISDPVIILDRQHNIIEANPAAHRILNREPGSLVGEKCYQVHHRTTRPPAECPHAALLRSRHPETMEMEIEAVGGTFQVTVAPIFDDQGDFVRTVHIAHDVTDHKRLEQENLAARDRIIREMEAHRQYVFAVADRLRNPLQLLRGYLDLFQRDNLTDEQREMLENIQRSTERLDAGLNQLT